MRLCSSQTQCVRVLQVSMRKPSLRSRVLNSFTVKRALELGWKMRPMDNSSYRHFYFEGPIPFAAHFYIRADCPHFTVGHQSTSYEPQAIRWLEEAAA